MKTVLAALIVLVLVAPALGSDWVKKGDVWESTETVKATYDQATVYNAKEQSKAWQALLGKLGCANLTPADADMLTGVAHNLRQGRSVADQKATFDKLVSEIPNVPKPEPVTIKDNLEVPE